MQHQDEYTGSEPARSTDRGAEDGRAAGGAKETVRNVAEATKEKVGETAHAAKQTVEATAHRAKEKTREQAGVARQRVRQGLDRQIEQQRVRAATNVADVSDAVRDAESSLQERNHRRTAEYVGRMADRIESLAHRLETAHPRDLFSTANELARRRPKVTVAALFLGGFALGRFLRASESHDDGARGEGAGNGRRDDDAARWLDDGGALPEAGSVDRGRSAETLATEPGSIPRSTEDYPV